MPNEPEHVILVAFQVKAVDRAEAQNLLMEQLPRPSMNDIECWWVAEDDRIDGSDCDSAVFVKPGAQAIAVDLLHGMDLTDDCNLSQGANSIFEQP